MGPRALPELVRCFTEMNPRASAMVTNRFTIPPESRNFSYSLQRLLQISQKLLDYRVYHIRVLLKNRPWSLCLGFFNYTNATFVNVFPLMF